MAGDRDSSGGLLALVALGLCCGLPILLGAGVAVGAAGPVLGSGAVVAAGIMLAAWGWRRRRKRCRHQTAAEARR